MISPLSTSFLFIIAVALVVGIIIISRLLIKYGVRAWKMAFIMFMFDSIIFTKHFSYKCVADCSIPSSEIILFSSALVSAAGIFLFLIYMVISRILGVVIR